MERSLPLIRARTLMSSFTLRVSIHQRAGGTTDSGCYSVRGSRRVMLGRAASSSVLVWQARLTLHDFIGNHPTPTLLAFDQLHRAPRASPRCACDSRSG